MKNFFFKTGISDSYLRDLFYYISFCIIIFYFSLWHFDCIQLQKRLEECCQARSSIDILNEVSTCNHFFVNNCFWLLSLENEFVMNVILVIVIINNKCGIWAYELEFSHWNLEMNSQIKKKFNKLIWILKKLAYLNINVFLIKYNSILFIVHIHRVI